MNGAHSAALSVVRSLMIDPCGHCDAREIGLCAAMPDEFIVQLSTIMRVIRLDPGTALISEGDDARHYFTLTSGSAKLYKTLADGRQQIIGFLFTGDFVGFGARDLYPYTVEALSKATACRFQRGQLEGVLHAFPELEFRLRGMASDEIAQAHDHMMALGRKTAKERVAGFLMHLSERMRRLGQPSNPMTLPMTRSDIAQFLGLTLETVSRVFSDLKAEGAISTGPGRAVTLDLQRLTAIDGEGIG